MPIDWTHNIPIDLEDAIVPFAASTLAAAVLPSPYWWWWLAAQCLVGTSYLIERRHRFVRPLTYFVLHLVILGLLSAALVFLRR